MGAPPAKKRRIQAAVAASEANEHFDGNESSEKVLSCSQATATPKNSNEMGVLIEQHSATIQSFLSSINDLTSEATAGGGDDEAAAELLEASSLALTNLKSLQLQICREVEHHASQSREKRERVEEMSLTLQNLSYERNYLTGRIRECRRCEVSELEKMAWDELDVEPLAERDDGEVDEDGREEEEGKKPSKGSNAEVAISNDDQITKEAKQEADTPSNETPRKASTAPMIIEGATTASKSEITTAEQAIDAYLLSSSSTLSSPSHRDPANYDHILAKLQSDLQMRSTLVEQLARAKVQLGELQKKRDSLRQFLQQIPKKILELERCGEGLNSFFTGFDGWKDALQDDQIPAVANAAPGKTTPGKENIDNGLSQEKMESANLIAHMPSSHRTKRFRLAKSNLPSPLYVLFVQLVGYIDAWASLQHLQGGNKSNSGKDSKSIMAPFDAFVGAAGMEVFAMPPENSENMEVDDIVMEEGEEEEREEEGGEIIEGDGNDNNEGGENSVEDISDNKDDNEHDKDGDLSKKHRKEWSVVLSLSPSEIVPSEVVSIFGKAHYSSISSSGSSSGRNDKNRPVIKIIFSYNHDQGVVMATVEDEEFKQLEEGLLEHLFPEDDGSHNPNSSTVFLKSDEDDYVIDDNEQAFMEKSDEASPGQEGGEKINKNNDNEQVSEESLVPGKPYHWCQILSGISFPPPVADVSSSNLPPLCPIQVCTKAVLRQLLRHIRARRTLASLLEFLGKRTHFSSAHPLPIHPSMKSTGSRSPGKYASAPPTASPTTPTAKLFSWTEDTNFDKEGLPSSSKCYIAIIKRKNVTLKASVLIDMHRYPSEPPIWKLRNDDGSPDPIPSWGERHGTIVSLQGNNANNDASLPPLFDAALHRIEYHVNHNLDQFIIQDLETTYDWILLHQLVEIISCWDDLRSVVEGNGNGKNGEDSSRRMGYQRRVRRGKDRRLVAFGENSPFYCYWKGL